MKPGPVSTTRFALLLLLLHFSSGAVAQTKDSPLTKWYLQFGGGPGTRSGEFLEFSFQGVVRDKWSFTVSWHDFVMEPKNLPSDFIPESGVILFLPYTNNVEVDMKLISLTAGKFIPLGRKTWLSAEAGISFADGQKASFKRIPQENTGFLFVWGTSSNYESTIEDKSALGVMLRTDFNWAVTSFMGLGTGVFANFNSVQSPLGFNVKLIVGAMGIDKKDRSGRRKR